MSSQQRGKAFYIQNVKIFIIILIIAIFTPVFADVRDDIRTEADYILACQFNPTDPADTHYSSRGAINDITGNPTWVVPRENGMAILGLITASEVLDEPLYIDRANLTADYLVSIQDSDGAWCNWYNYRDIVDRAKSPTQTAEVMIALNKLGYVHDRYNSIRRGAQYLMNCQRVENIGGIDHGLLGGGKDSSGTYSRRRWASDNSYAYWALKAAEFWAVIENEIPFANECRNNAQRILDGIDTYLYNPATGVWHIVIDENGVPLGNPDVLGHPELPNWINYAPQMLDLPVYGVNLPEVGDWIQNAFQQLDGSCIAYAFSEGELKTRKYPGYSFQASLVWFDTGHSAYADSAISWAATSGLRQTVPDPNGIRGGFIDWIEISPDTDRIADWWFRFIDTSFYAIACLNGGYDFRFSPWILNLEIPFYEEERECYSAAASCKMILDFIREDTILTQDELYSFAATPPREIDLLGVKSILNNYHPAGYNFAIRAKTTLQESMRDICHWMDYEVSAVSVPQVPAAVPTFGNYSNWIVVRGATASNDPSDGDSFTVFGFWINDPGVSGIGENSYKTAAECELTYFLPLATGDSWDGKYAAVSEPPLIPNRKKIQIAKYQINKSTKKIINLLKIKDSIKIRRFNWENIIDPYLLEDNNFRTSLSGATARTPIKVKRLDKLNSDYYLVPFVNYRTLTSAVLIIDAGKGCFKEASWVARPMRYLPVTEERAKQIVRRTLKAPSILNAELVWKPTKKSSSPYCPFWEVTTKGKTWYVYQDGSM